MLKDFSKIKVLIVGDVMIDRYCWGSVERISPEAPVPIVRLEKTTTVAGGAANVAANVAGLGAQPFLIGAIGDDADGKIFSELLQSNGINPEYLLKIKNRPTTVKTRIIAHSQQIARIDREVNSAINAVDEKRAGQIIEKIIDLTDVIILSDYAKGFLTEKLIKRLITIANKNYKLVLVDPKGKNFSKYKNAAFITPNRGELAEACGVIKPNASTIEDSAARLISELNLKAILVTLGEDGMTLFEKGKRKVQLKASARKVYDVTGAGDTVIAALAVAVQAGYEWADAAEFANRAAGFVVERLGTTAIRIENMRDAFAAGGENTFRRN